MATGAPPPSGERSPRADQRPPAARVAPRARRWRPCPRCRWHGSAGTPLGTAGAGRRRGGRCWCAASPAHRRHSRGPRRWTWSQCPGPRLRRRHGRPAAWLCPSSRPSPAKLPEPGALPNPARPLIATHAAAHRHPCGCSSPPMRPLITPDTHESAPSRCTVGEGKAFQDPPQSDIRGVIQPGDGRTVAL